MPHQCPFPVRSTDNRRSYRAGSIPGCALGLALVAALLGYASFSRAEPVALSGWVGSASQEVPPGAGRTQTDRLPESSN